MSQSLAQSPTAEIEHLLNFVSSSGCQFYRNGVAYTSEEAASHMRSKYNSPAALGRIHNAVDFIQRIASSSSLTGNPYSVRCAGAPEVHTESWLTAELLRSREQLATSTTESP